VFIPRTVFLNARSVCFLQILKRLYKIETSYNGKGNKRKTMSLTLSELYQVHRMKDLSKKSSYKRVLELAQRRIRNVNGYGGMNTFYEVPGMMVGYPLYNIYECMGYVVDELRRVGFLVQILPPPHICVLYISWDPKELKPDPKRPALEGGGGSKQKRLTRGEDNDGIPLLNNGKYF
jgi:hypothetical protein